MSEHIPGIIKQEHPPELPLSLAKLEPLTLIKNEPSESDEEIIPDIKRVDIISDILHEGSIKSETLPETIVETKYSECPEYDAPEFVKTTETATFIKIENITESVILNNLKDTSDNINKNPYQGVIQVKDEMYDQNLNFRCNKCDYKANTRFLLKTHILIHVKPDEIEYFYCYHCPHRSNRKHSLTTHIRRHYKKGDVSFHCYICDFVTPQRDLLLTHIKNKEHVKFELHQQSRETETAMNNQYFYCYHCPRKYAKIITLKTHILKHFEKEEIKFHCYICDFVTLKRYLVTKHIREHRRKVEF